MQEIIDRFFTSVKNKDVSLLNDFFTDDAVYVERNGATYNGITQIKSGERYVYYFGSAWSKNDVRTFNEWKLRSEETLNAIHAPLHTAVE